MNIFEEKKNLFVISFLFVVMGVALRFLPHAPNFTPIAGIALFAGVYFSRKIALILPIAVMLVSDIFIGFYNPMVMISVYASFLLCVFLGFWLKKNKTRYTVLASSFLCAILFFLITNFAVWAFTPWYGKTLSGLLHCYVMAIPFFRNTLIGNLFYVGLFFGAYELAKIFASKAFKNNTLKKLIFASPIYEL